MVSARKLVRGAQATQMTWSEKTILIKMTLKGEEQEKESSKQRKNTHQDPEEGERYLFLKATSMFGMC